MGGNDIEPVARKAAGGVTGDGMHVLHSPDQVAGGRPEGFTGLGDGNINSSLGGQWRTRTKDLQEAVGKQMGGIPPDLWGFINLNTSFIT
jgi:hypothetical protein